MPEILAKLTDYTDSRGKKGDPNYIITYYLQQNTFTDSQVPELINGKTKEREN